MGTQKVKLVLRNVFRCALESLSWKKPFSSGPPRRSIRIAPRLIPDPVSPEFYESSKRGHWKLRAHSSHVHKRLPWLSTCIVQIRKTIAPSIDTPRVHTTSGARIKEVTSPATEQNSSAPIAFRKPASVRKARCPIAEAARRAATATNPRMRGAITLLLTDRVGSRHAIAGNGFEDPWMDLS